MRQTRILICLTAVLLCISACNAFEWSYSAEDSGDYQFVLAEADAHFRNRNYKKAFTLYDHACAIQSNSSRAHYGRMQSRMFIRTEAEPLLLTFAAFVSSTNTAKPLATIDSSLRDFLLPDLESSSRDILAIVHPASDGVLTTNSSWFLSDAALVLSAWSFFLLCDSNSNTIPCENSDVYTINENFTLEQTQPVPASSVTNLRLWLSNQIPRLTQARFFCQQLLLNEPVYGQTNSSFWVLENNLAKTLQSIQACMTNIEEES